MPWPRKRRDLATMFDSGKALEVRDCNDELMLAVQQGDLDAYQELIHRYQKKVYRVIAAYHRNPDDAIEVLQDTFLKVYTARRTWKQKTSFAAWLYRIAINASIDRYRRGLKARAARLEDIVETDVRPVPGTRPPASAIDLLRGEERRKLLEDAVRRLPARQREVVSLRYFGEMRLEEIASALSCPLGTVKSNLHKAVNSLKNHLLSQKELLGHD
jgi:RNA polymerase sigma-70 factor (ECF subfamily)